MRDLFGSKRLAAAVTLMVLVVVVVGIVVAGSPQRVRQTKFDDLRVNALRDISNAVDTHYNTAGSVPMDIDALQTAYSYLDLRDPETGEGYEYRATGEDTFRLCAVFSAPSDDVEDRRAFAPPRPYAIEGSSKVRDWTHEAGRHCFDLQAELLQIGRGCSLTNPCDGGQTCAVLPGRATAICVPQGQECRAAGCATDTCAIAESYPVQVFCNAEASE